MARAGMVLRHRPRGSGRDRRDGLEQRLRADRGWATGNPSSSAAIFTAGAVS